MTLGSERGAVQNPFVRYATEVGWQYLAPDEATRLRRGESGLVLHDVLVRHLQELNPDVVNLERAEEVITELQRVRPNIEGNEEAWKFIKGLRTVFVPEQRREMNVRLLDPAKVEANSFHVTEELWVQSGNNRIRLDIAFFINGIPVVVVETKSAKLVDGMMQALDQIRRYHRECPEYMAVAQLYAITHLSHFYYAPTWSLSSKSLFNWREEGNFDFETLVKRFIDPSRVLRLITDSILFVRKDGELSKVVLRPHQMRAIERVLVRASDTQKRRALVWHTQGSGKTYTMISVARRLIEDPRFQNPTVLMLVDRNELEQQLFDNLKEVGFGHVEVAKNKRGLRDLLRHDQRGLIVSTIHKFERMPLNICTRSNIFVLIDEAHRTTGGDLGNYLMGALPNATYIGFTGTPIDKTAYGKGTFKVFGIDDQPHGYLDRYSIKDSIEDGTTVPLHYALAPNELQVDRDTLDREFFGLTELEGVSDIEELNRVLDRAVTLKNMLKSERRMRKVAEFVAQHFREKIEPMGYKAFLVAVDREACCKYKVLLDEHLPSDYSQVVISKGTNDSEELRAFHLNEIEEKRVRGNFKKPNELPKILIVTEKLLTGFDAPILYCMYLDKPMRDHCLLQAIARVNRPYEDEDGRRKPSGFVLDFVGIFDNLERALAFDSRDIHKVVAEVGVLKERFSQLLERGRREYLTIIQELKGDKAVEAVLEHFRNPDLRGEYYRYLRELQDTYEILSPDEFLRPFLDDYRALCEIYQVLRSNYEARPLSSLDLLKKTASLVQEHTDGVQFRSATDIFKIGVEKLESLAQDDSSETVKVFNLIRAIRQIVAEEGTKKGYLIPIGERAEAILQRYQERQITTQEMLRQIRDGLVKQLKDAEFARSQSKLSPEAFTVLWLLKWKGVEDAEERAGQIGEAVKRYPHWRTSEQHGRELRIEIYKALRSAGIENLSSFVEKLFNILRGSKDDETGRQA